MHHTLLVAALSRLAAAAHTAAHHAGAHAGEENVLETFGHALMITGFVFTMMLVIEYLNVLTRGAWQGRLAKHGWGQYLLGAFLGSTPGCLGAFATVTMYSHGMVSMGAVVAAMIATSGDEAYVMLAMIPKQALGLFAALFVIGVLAGALTDLFVRRSRPEGRIQSFAFDVHEDEACFAAGHIGEQWRQCTAARGVLSVGLALFVIALAVGWVGPPVWNWIRITLILSAACGLFIVITVPDHFLEKHLWEHVARKHAPRIFLWTFGALLVMYFLTQRLHLGEEIRAGKWVVLLIACLIGLIPESGPHLIFVTLYAHGDAPLSVLLASSIVQDGHGMLPLLAESGRAFLQIKAVNFLVGLLCGAAVMAAGY